MQQLESGETMTIQRRVGLLYDERMCKHHTPDDDYHPENPYRIKAIWNKLLANNIPQRCVVLNAKEAEDKYLLAVHSKNHVNLIRNISSNQFDSRRNRIALKFNSIYFNDGSSEAAYIAAGSVVEVAERVAKGELHSSAAIVRPPGHHAEHDEAMGFCLFNNVAVAASYLLDERPELGIKKILIVDWDVHHGNGTQKMFWKDPRVLFFSVHRHEFGNFYPANDDGFYTMIGEGPGAGYNINVPWENGRCGDADYLAVWDHILIPVAKEFDPDMILVSAGFDAAIGDPLGGCRVTPYGYSVMLKKLMDFAHGKIVLALEGGYNLDSIANSFLACMEVLLESKPIAGSSEAYPFESTWRVIQAVRKKLSAYWPSLADEIPLKLTSQKAPPAHLLISSSDSEDEDEKSPNIVSDNMVKVVQEIVEPLSKLKVEDIHGKDQVARESVPWRSELSKMEIWYATYGSNMWKRRFLCYIQGGQVDGMRKPCPGSMDKNPPKEILWKTFSRRLFFGRESTRTWGPGGVAFLNPETSVDEKTYICMYRITLEQFNDVLFQENIALQENVSSCEMGSPAFHLADLESVEKHGSMSLEVFKGWYHNVVYLGKEQDIPILTMTCSLSDVERFKSGKVPLCAPCKEYANTLIQGLIEGGQFSEEEAITYIEEASSKPI
ncbi:histone deacetylase 5 isoform X2 [Manihot esculenta]|uniref:histone deacetylase n=1 Tax=Manihot esculenta TaxID=3983 RepID=A0A2C9VP85_MANES|nr:histone deacetylase 5 isoform X2 [Manihot esculenta]